MNCPLHFLTHPADVVQAGITRSSSTGSGCWCAGKTVIIPIFEESMAAWTVAVANSNLQIIEKKKIRWYIKFSSCEAPLMDHEEMKEVFLLSMISLFMSKQ